MHPTTTEPPSTTTTTVTLNLISLLLLATHKSFLTKWQLIHTKLLSLHLSLSSLPSSPNTLLHHTILPSLHSTLRQLKSLSDQDSAISGKLRLRSDLDMADSSLHKVINDINLLLRSGVLHHGTAIVLSRPAPDSKHDDLVFFVRDLFTRIQIGGVEFKIEALQSLIELLGNDDIDTDHAKLHSVVVGTVVKEGSLAYLIRLLDISNHDSIREQAVTVVSILVTSSLDCVKSVFEEGGLGPLLRMIETGSNFLKEKAAIAVESITADPENVWAISAYDGVSVLLEACRSGSSATQTHSAGALKNIAAVDDFRVPLGQDGAIPVLIHLLDSANARENAAKCLSILASTDEYLRILIIQERGLQKLMQTVHDYSNLDTDTDTVQHVLHALLSFTTSESINRTMSSSTTFVVSLGELIKLGNTTTQQLASSLMSKLSISDGNKRAIATCMPHLVRLMEFSKPVNLPLSAAQALVTLLSVKSNLKQLVRDEKSVMRLIQMLDPENEKLGKNNNGFGSVMMVVSAVVAGGSFGCRRRLVVAGASAHLQRLSEMEVVGAKKAVQRLNENRLKSIFSMSWRE